MKIIITDDGKSIGVSVTDCGDTKPYTKELVGILEYAKFALITQEQPNIEDEK